MDRYKDNEFIVKQWVYNLIATDTAVNNTLLIIIGNTSLILAEKLSHITPVEQLISTKTHSHAATSLSILNIYCTQTYYKVTGCYTKTPLNYLEGNSNQQSTTDRDYLLRPSQPIDGINKDNNIFYPFISSTEWA